ncbi:SCO family protein [Domibacillus antri]|nr:SCO family protein [Domibacillus antri]
MKLFRYMTLAAVIMILLSACSSSEFQGNMEVEVNDFTNVNQDGKEVSLSDLKGNVWIANFIFTNCTTVCPPMTRNMSELQDLLNEEGIKNYRIVSFSVDPARDTPDALKKYISHYEADESNWDLLTGYDSDYIRDFAEESFQTLAIPDPNSDQFMHGTSFYLINKEGIVVKSYDGNIDVPFDEIVLDVKQLTEQS